MTTALTVLGLVALALLAWWSDRRAWARDTPHWTALKANKTLLKARASTLGPRTRFTGDPDRHRLRRPTEVTPPAPMHIEPPRDFRHQAANVLLAVRLAEVHEVLALARAFARRRPDATVVVHGPQGDRRGREIVN